MPLFCCLAWELTSHYNRCFSVEKTSIGPLNSKQWILAGACSYLIHWLRTGSMVSEVLYRLRQVEVYLNLSVEAFNQTFPRNLFYLPLGSFLLKFDCKPQKHMLLHCSLSCFNWAYKLPTFLHISNVIWRKPPQFVDISDCQGTWSRVYL